MFYKKNVAEKLNQELFENPTSEYRGTPFWAWNTKLNKELLSEQIEQLKEMGFGGFHMHPRTGLETTYLSEEFMEFVAHCVDKAKTEDMLAWLYDEDRWPSGFAGGLVTKDAEYRARYLLFTKVPYREGEIYTNDGDSASRGCRTGKGNLLAVYDITLDEKGYLKGYKQINKEAEALGDRWHAYLEVSLESSWFNNQTYVDTLNEKAMQKFIEITYETYKNKIKDEFGQVVPAIFTDEPQFTHKTTLNFAHEEKDIIIPWTDDLALTYEKVYEENLINKLPEIFWELGEDKVSATRYRYHDHIAERFAVSFADQCGKWCEENGLLLTGHMMEEPTLGSQTAALGEAMRSYRSFGLPGIDMLCDSREYTTAKQAQSAAHQFGREGVLSELYGVTNWDFDFRGHKLQGDWQAALGVTVRVPHLTWVSMEGEAKRDYPASIGYQSPWYKEYPLIEDHFARLNTVLTRGVPSVKVGVIHPIESYWLHYGPRKQTETIRADKEEKFRAITAWLLFGAVDFDFIAESLLPNQCEKGSNPLQVGQMNYQVIIVPECETLRSTTYERLAAFKAKGGRLIFLGEAPRYMDALPSEQVKALYNQSEQISYNQTDLLRALEEEREISLLDEAGNHTSQLLYQMRDEGKSKWLFICHGKLPRDKDVADEEKIIIKLKGHFKPTLYDTITGEIRGLGAIYDGEHTIIHHKFYAHDSILIKLDLGRADGCNKTTEVKESGQQIEIHHQVPIVLEEPNVYLLDRAAYKLDDGLYEKEEEILRLDNKCREQLGYLPRGGQVAQPWVLETEVLKHEVTLKFTVKCEIEVEGALLATEKLEDTYIVVNGEIIDKSIKGWFVDRSIKTMPLPKLLKGENIIEIKYPFGKTTHLEWCYLLGDFGVEVRGEEKTIIAKSEQLAFGDITTQGLPFYAGNITYKMKVRTTKEKLVIQLPQYRGALVSVSLDGQEVGKIVFAPYTLTLENIRPGEHEIELKVFGNRVNAFGAVHNCDEAARWFGPDGWRSTGERWSYGYTLKEIGILTSPSIAEK